MPSSRQPRARWNALALATTGVLMVGLAFVPTLPTPAQSPLFERLELRPPTSTRRVVLGACGLPGEALLEDRYGAYFRVRVQGRRPRLEPVPVCTPPATPQVPDLLPDSTVARDDGPIALAWLAAPTTRYRHAVLGDALEAGELRVRLNSGLELRHRLDVDMVFEDLHPRIVDLNSDGQPELLVVRSSVERGAALALLAIEDGELRTVAASEPIGQPNRWLNPVGVADFTGGGRQEIAAVVTPHLGGTLTLFRREGHRLVPIHSAPGFSNHAPGSRELGLSAVLELGSESAPVLAVPDAQRKRLRIVSFADGSFRELEVVDHGRDIVSGIHVLDLDADGVEDLLYLLDDGRVILLLQQ